MNQQQSSPQKITMSDALGIIYVIANSHASAITPLIRRAFGSEAFNPYGLVAFVALLALTGGRWATPMGIYAIAWFIALLYRRFETFRFRQRGVAIHSRYMGYPWLAMRFRHVKTEEQAKAFEPLLCLLAGVALCLVSQTLGCFVMAGFVSMGVSMCIDKLVFYKRVERMQDAMIEGEYYAGEMRKVR